MKILIGCEYSGIVRDAFIAQGHDAWSCDIIPTEAPGPHIQDDVLNHLNDGWDMMIAHPPCQYLSYSGVRWFKKDASRWDRALEAFYFFMQCIEAPIPMIAVENGCGYTWQWYRRPDQIVEPYWFGHDVTKATGLWLKNLPPLMATLVHNDPFVNWTKYKGSHTGKARAKTFPGLAAAMAHQWSRQVA